MPKVPTRLLLLLPATRACKPFAAALLTATTLAACVSAGPIMATPGACSSLIPDAWRLGVEGAELPAGETVGDWIAFADAQTGRLDVANGRTNDAIGIIERCEARDQLAVKRSKPRFLGVF